MSEHNVYANATSTLTNIPPRLINSDDVASELSLINSAVKQSPESLAEELNNAVEATGAVIFIKNLSRNGEITHITNNFYLTGLQISLKERVQLLENFKSSSVSFFGNSAKVYQLQGVAVDYGSTNEADPGEFFHQSSLIDMYENQLRGSKLVENNSVAILKVLNHTIEGYPINMNVVYSSSQDKMAQFTMTWVVISHDLLLENYLNDARLKNFYSLYNDEELKEKKATTENITQLIRFCSDVLNLQNRVVYPEKFTKEDVFFEYFGNGETFSILNTLETSKYLLSTEQDAIKEYLKLLSKYLTILTRDKYEKIKSLLPQTNITVFLDSEVDLNSFSTNEERRIQALDLFRKYMKEIQTLKKDLIILKVNSLYKRK